MAPPTGSGRPFFYAETAGFWVLLLASCAVAFSSRFLDSVSHPVALLAKFPLGFMLLAMLTSLRSENRPTFRFALALGAIVLTFFLTRVHGGLQGGPPWAEAIATGCYGVVIAWFMYLRIRNRWDCRYPGVFEYEDWKTKKGPLD